ncbi:MAG TPA: signal peptidase I [Rhodocyclaceae bacterium]|nr:signal peptidase I [Rhodocyclaceae bacterium]
MKNPISIGRPVVAKLMSIVLPGLGQLYNGELNKAIWLFIGFAFFSIPGAAFLALHLPGRLMTIALLLSLIAALGIWIFGSIDALRVARRKQDDMRQGWQVSGLYALVLIVCNGFALPALIGYVRTHQVEAFRVPATSMAPNVLKGDFIFADKRYNCPGCKQAVRRGDIVIFVNPNDRTQYFIKRIIGLPGESIQIKDRHVLVDGKSLTQEQAGTNNDKEITESDGKKRWQVIWATSNKQQPDVEITVPAGQVFLLGDNRGSSTDSRAFGTVPLMDVVGKARQVWFSSDASGVRWGRLGKMLD